MHTDCQTWYCALVFGVQWWIFRLLYRNEFLDLLCICLLLKKDCAVLS